jgi:pimeloyl-ACP methyl ester carboxylesterase
VEDVDLGVCPGRWYAGDPIRVVVVLPGARYLPFGPLLWFAREIAQSHGWSVLEVWDEYLDRSEDPERWVQERLEAALEHAGDAEIVLVTKSLTSRAVTIAADRNLPGIWLTPLLAMDAEIAAGFERLQAPALLIGGTADESWDGELARRGGHQVLELEGANHALELEGHPLASIDLLRTVAVRIDLFIVGLVR